MLEKVESTYRRVKVKESREMSNSSVIRLRLKFEKGLSLRKEEDDETRFVVVKNGIITKVRMEDIGTGT